LFDEQQRYCSLRSKKRWLWWQLRQLRYHLHCVMMRMIYDASMRRKMKNAWRKMKKR
jgi:hypothetical protein